MFSWKHEPSSKGVAVARHFSEETSGSLLTPPHCLPGVTWRFTLWTSNYIGRKGKNLQETVNFLSSVVSHAEMYFDTEWSCCTSPWKIVITCPLVLQCCSSQELEEQSRRLQETLSDILKLARVGAVFQRFVSFVNSCGFALFARLFRAWMAALSMKLGKATEEMRRNDYKNK